MKGSFIKIDKAIDTAGNAISGTASALFIHDTTPPNIVLEWNKDTNFFKGGENIEFTASFDEAIGLHLFSHSVV